MVRLVQNAGAGRELAITLPIVGAKLEDQLISHGHSLGDGSLRHGLPRSRSGCLSARDGVDVRRKRMERLMHA
jgi:hypothetical protein